MAIMTLTTYKTSLSFTTKNHQTKALSTYRTLAITFEYKYLASVPLSIHHQPHTHIALHPSNMCIHYRNTTYACGHTKRTDVPEFCPEFARGCVSALRQQAREGRIRSRIHRDGTMDYVSGEESIMADWMNRHRCPDRVMSRGTKRVEYDCSDCSGGRSDDSDDEICTNPQRHHRRGRNHARSVSRHPNASSRSPDWASPRHPVRRATTHGGRHGRSHGSRPPHIRRGTRGGRDWHDSDESDSSSESSSDDSSDDSDDEPEDPFGDVPPLGAVVRHVAGEIFREFRRQFSIRDIVRGIRAIRRESRRERLEERSSREDRSSRDRRLM